MNRVVQMWNKLPDEVVQASTIKLAWTAIGLKLDTDTERPMA